MFQGGLWLLITAVKKIFCFVKCMYIVQNVTFHALYYYFSCKGYNKAFFKFKWSYAYKNNSYANYAIFNILLFLSYLCVGVLRKVFRVLVVDYTVSHYCFSFHIWYLKYCSWFSCMCTLKRLQIFGFLILIVGSLLLLLLLFVYIISVYTIVFILQNICICAVVLFFLGCSKNSLFKKVQSIFCFFLQSNKFRNNAILQLFVFFILCDFTKNDKYVIIWAVYKITKLLVGFSVN